MKKSIRLSGLDCANCAAKMEEAVRGIEGVEAVSVNFLTQKMVLEAEDSRFGRRAGNGEEAHRQN